MPQGSVHNCVQFSNPLVITSWSVYTDCLQNTKLTSQQHQPCNYTWLTDCIAYITWLRAVKGKLALTTTVYFNKWGEFLQGELVIWRACTTFSFICTLSFNMFCTAVKYYENTILISSTCYLNWSSQVALCCNRAKWRHVTGWEAWYSQEILDDLGITWKLRRDRIC